METATACGIEHIPVALHDLPDRSLGAFSRNRLGQWGGLRGRDLGCGWRGNHRARSRSTRLIGLPHGVDPFDDLGMLTGLVPPRRCHGAAHSTDPTSDQGARADVAACDGADPGTRSGAEQPTRDGPSTWGGAAGRHAQRHHTNEQRGDEVACHDGVSLFRLPT
jgi:hypothetical protein